MIKKPLITVQRFLIFCITFFPIFNLVAEEAASIFRKPIIKNGRYYYSERDTHNHISKMLLFLPKKALKTLILTPQKLVAYLINQENKEKEVPLNVTLPQPIQTKPQEASIKPVITWIGHASFLIQIGGFNILTDPLFGDAYAGPIHITNRTVAPGIRLEDLPRIHFIVISHNHADHTCKKSLSAIRARYPDVKILVPAGNAALMKSIGFDAESIIENTWWDEYTAQKNDQELKITCLPAKHWSIYISPFGYRKALWASWMISCNNKNIYFAGDTAYDDHFKQIAQKFGHIEVALMPIAPTSQNPDEHNVDHVNAKEAINAFIDLQASCFIPMHWGTIFENPQSLVYPINLMYEYWESKKNAELEGKKLLLAGWGQPYALDL